MKSSTPAKANWQDMLDRISRLNANQQIAIQINTPIIGSQMEAEQVQFLGITYDPKDDSDRLRPTVLNISSGVPRKWNSHMKVPI